MIPLGFRVWVKENLEDNSEMLASYLVHCVKEGGQDSIVWDLLKETGDKYYSVDTFRKAANIVINIDPTALKRGDS